jgi:hypothetical protein
LKNRKRIGASADPCERPACRSACTSVVNSLTRIHACRSVKKSCTHQTIVLRICLCRSLLISSPVATLLYALLTSNDTSDSVFFPLYALNIFSQRYDKACVVDLCFQASKCVLSRRLYFSVRYAILSATRDSSAFPSVGRREIGL